MNVLVTGGGGFLGSAICRELAGLGHRVTAYQRSPAPHLADCGVEFVTGDICDRERLAATAKGCDAIVHTAARAGIWGEPADYHRINVEGTRSVVAACRTAGVGLLVHTSSPSVVHSGEDIEGGDESLPLATHFSAPYPETKAMAERRVLAANGTDLKTCALRPHLIWGPGDPHILPRLAAKARGGRLALPAPHKVIDTVYVDNAAHAHVRALQELAGRARCAGKAYFVTNNEPLPQGEIIQRLLAALGIEVRIKPVPAKLALAAGALCEWAWRFFMLKGEPPVTRFSVEQLATAHWFDTSAAVRDFGYLQSISIVEGLAILAEKGL